MVAEFKSHVLKREEKGMFGIPFKRLLGAGVGGVMIFMVARFLFAVGALPIGGVGFIGLLVLSAQRGGLSLYTRLRYQIRGWLIIAAASQPDSLIAQMAELMELPTHLVILDGAQVYAPPEKAAVVDLAQWETYAAPDEDGQGLIFMEDA
ncbi:MAG: hypothetical protein BroJett018_22030 [Chloroflexota bacterium]|nr:hypothetical protein [Chloroflexota bacterium]GIK64409.1 MAG: hypothetical protein BroJett018_22030 [Chloroflexota bacterium]